MLGNSCRSKVTSLSKERLPDKPSTTEVNEVKTPSEILDSRLVDNSRLNDYVARLHDVMELAWEEDEGAPPDILYSGASYRTELGSLLETSQPERLAEGKGIRLERQWWHLSYASPKTQESQGDGDDARMESFGVAYRVVLQQRNIDAKIRTFDKITEMTTEYYGDMEGKDFVAVNGGFYDTNLQPMGLVVSDSEEKVSWRGNGGSGILIKKNGGYDIIHKSRWKREKSHVTFALQSIDRILAKGQSLVSDDRAERATARTLIGVDNEFMWIIVLFATRSQRSEWPTIQLKGSSFLGLPLWGAAQYLRITTKATEGINLDGGVSTSMVGEIGGKKFHIVGERGTINSPYFFSPQ